MKLFRDPQGWLAADADSAVRLNSFSLDQWLRQQDPLAELKKQFDQGRKTSLSEARRGSGLPVESQEIWAAGVTYLRSKAARMEESDFSASAYDRVYEAPRPELFFKGNARRTAPDGGGVTLRDDSKWMVPEPELTLVVSSSGKLVGFTLGNDMSCRDIEGDNTLYLPQAKVWDLCCSIGPAILIADNTVDIRASTISLDILRDGASVFSGSTPISRIKRSFEELIGWLFKNQSFPDGVFLLTGTGIVPPDEFTLKSGDEIRIEVPEIGRLTNKVL